MDDPFELDPTPDSPDEEKNVEALNEQLKTYYKAMEEEWETGEKFKEGQLPPEEIRDKTKELLTQAVPKAVARLLYLTQHAKNESVQMKAATYIIDKAIGKEVGGLVGDPVEELLARINKE